MQRHLLFLNHCGIILYHLVMNGRLMKYLKINILGLIVKYPLRVRKILKIWILKILEKNQTMMIKEQTQTKALKFLSHREQAPHVFRELALLSWGSKHYCHEGARTTCLEGSRQTRTRTVRSNPRYFGSEWTNMARQKTKKSKFRYLEFYSKLRMELCYWITHTWLYCFQGNQRSICKSL